MPGNGTLATTDTQQAYALLRIVAILVPLIGAFLQVVVRGSEADTFTTARAIPSVVIVTTMVMTLAGIVAVLNAGFSGVSILEGTTLVLLGLVFVGIGYISIQVVVAVGDGLGVQPAIRRRTPEPPPSYLPATDREDNDDGDEPQ